MGLPISKKICFRIGKKNYDFPDLPDSRFPDFTFFWGPIGKIGRIISTKLLDFEYVQCNYMIWYYGILYRFPNFRMIPISEKISYWIDFGVPTFTPPPSPRKMRGRGLENKEARSTVFCSCSLKFIESLRACFKLFPSLLHALCKIVSTFELRELFQAMWACSMLCELWAHFKLIKLFSKNLFQGLRANFKHWN